MTKFQWNESINMFRDHVDQEKEQHLKQIIIETDTKVERIVKLVKSVNSGNKEAKLKKRSEAILLIEDFYKQYQSMCAMYEDLRDGVKKKCNNEDVKEDNESTSSCSSSNLLSMESSAYHSPGSGSKTPSIDQASYSLESLNVENTFKEEERGRTVEKLMKETENLKDYKYANLENKSPSKMKVLEERFNALKLEIETLNCPRSEYEHEWKRRHDDFHKRNKENSGFRVQLAIKEKEGDVLKKLDKCEKFIEGKIDKSIDQVQNLQMEVNSLRTQNDEARKNFAYEKVKEMELLRIQNQEAEIELKKKTNEAADECEKMFNGKIDESMDRVQNLEMNVDSLQSQNEARLGKEKEFESLRIQYQESEIELEKKAKEAADECEKIFDGRIYESMNRVQNLETKVDTLRPQNEARLEKEKEFELLSIRNQESEIELKKRTEEAVDECETIFNGKIEESMNRVKNLEMEVDSLRTQNEARLAKEKEFELLRIQNQEAETELEKKTKEAADSLELLECLTEKLKQKTKNEEGLVEEGNSLKTRIQDLELKIESINDTNTKQRETISQLEEKLQEKEVQISILESKIECVKKDLSNKMKSLKSLEQMFKSLEIDKSEVEGKNDLLVATLEQKETLMSKLNHEAKSSFKASVKKMGEMVDEFRFKTEDSIRILSRRIRVAEQLHNETRDWYKKTINIHEQNRRDNELAFHSVKIITSMVSETLNVSETFGLRFVECCEDFTNRVSKVSCESKFVKDWVKRKNGVLVQVKDDYDKLVVQMDDKEEEILGSRQKVLKLETRLREIEKIVKENDETLIGLKEEKREAIRQLCVWIDYHRNRYDSLKKAFSEFAARHQRPG